MTITQQQRGEDDVEILELLKARRIEVVDGAGRTRIYLSAFTDGSAEVRVTHPDTTSDLTPAQIKDGNGLNEQVDVLLAAGMDTESDGYGRAGVYIEDGDRFGTGVDIITDAYDRAQLRGLDERIRRIEEVLSILAAAAGATKFLPLLVEVECPLCHYEIPIAGYFSHAGSEKCTQDATDRAGLDTLRARIDELEERS